MLFMPKTNTAKTPVKLWLILIVLSVIFLTGNAKAQYNSVRAGISNTYPTDFNNWHNAFLAGDGKLGIIVFGNPLDETVIFNDRKFNLAKTKDRSFAQVSPEDIAKIKSLCAAGNFAEANKLAVSSAHYSAGGEGNKHPGYEMLIHIPASGAITNYVRICNFRTGVITIKWTDDRGDWERKAFVSRKDNISIQYLTAPTKGKLNCDIQLAVDAKMLFPVGMTFINKSNSDYLNFRAKYPDGTNDAGYEGVTRVVVSGGTKTMEGNVLHIRNANSATLLTRTDKYYSNCEAFWNKKPLQKQLSAIPADYNTLLKGQLVTHQAIYDRVKIDLGASAQDRNKTNEELLAMQKDSPVPVKALWERIFDGGRYYYLSSSSNESSPDLLGIWAGDCNAGWGGFYHLDANANLQVSGGNIGNMPEAMEGYFKLNEEWRKDFEINATKLLGCRGMLAAGNTPGKTSGLLAGISDYYPYQYATGEEAWLLYPFWEHYLVTGDKKFLKERIYPLLKEMGYFYEDFLKLKDSSGNYIFAGSVSPENQPANVHVSLLNNSNFDISGAKFLLSALIETCNTLKLEQGKGQGVERWSVILSKVPPYLINNDGAMQEWSWPGLQDNYNHRHSSHLLPVWPYQEITPEKTPALFKAATTTLAKKDDFNYSNAGHGVLHSALIAADLKNGEAVNNKLLRLTREGWYFNSLATSHNSNHDIFCTDACNTVPTIMMEMLIGTEPGMLELLPALPKTLTKGAISGVKGRNQVTINNLDWDMDNGSVNCTITSAINQNITLIEREGIRTIKTNATVSTSPLTGIARVIHLKARVPTKILLGLNKY